MPKPSTAFLAGFVLAAAAAGAAWGLALGPKWKEREERAVLAERLAQRAKRDAVEAQQWAEKEQERRRRLEDENAELKRVISAPPTKQPPPGPTPPPNEGPPPEQWDRRRIGFEIEKLAEAPARVVGSARYAKVVQALKAKGDEGFQILADVAKGGFAKEWQAVAATLTGALGDPRGVPILLETRKTATDADVRRAALRGLANLPGDEATPILVAAWNDPTGAPIDRLLAIHGLARRMHETALAVAAGGAPISTPTLRWQAIRSLHAQARKNGWKDVALVPVFGKALRSADGDPQRETALLVLEGFWSKDSADDLDAFAASATGALAERAKTDAAALRFGKPRPPDAGEPTTRPTGSPVETEPAEPDPSNPPMEHR